MIEPHVAPGVTNDALDRLCHDHLLNVQGARPANLGYLDYLSYPKTVRPTPPFEAVRSYLFTYIKLTASA